VFPFLMLAASSVPAQQTSSEPRSPMITVSAHGEIQVVPDRAYILLSVQTRESSAAEAASENAAKQTAIITALRSMGIAASQISTQNYTVSPETRNDSGNHTPRVVSYLVSNSIRIEVSDLSLIGRVVDASLSHGANQVSSLSFFESNADQLYRNALTLAVSNAKAQANVMAIAAGGHLGELIELNSGEERFPSPVMGNVRMATFATAETPIMPGQEHGRRILIEGAWPKWSGALYIDSLSNPCFSDQNNCSR
jgi:uncharacterized protein YggE